MLRQPGNNEFLGSSNELAYFKIYRNNPCPLMISVYSIIEPGIARHRQTTLLIGCS